MDVKGSLFEALDTAENGPWRQIADQLWQWQRFAQSQRPHDFLARFCPVMVCGRN